MPTFVSTAPTSEDIFSMSKVKWRKLGINEAGDLDVYVVQAVAYVIEITGRFYSDWPAPTYDSDGSGSIDYYGYVVSAGAAQPIAKTPVKVPLMQQAVRLRTEQLLFQAQNGYMDTVTDDRVNSFTAGPYSESRGDPTRRGEEKSLNTMTALNDLLWALMTEDRYSFWLSFIQNQHVPAFAVEEVSWAMIGKDFGLAAPGSEPWPMWRP